MSIAVEALGREPIPGADRAGQPARYTPEFERLEAEITKLSSLTGGDIDWHAVATDAATVLSTRSKDLLAAVYLARAWFALEGSTGLERGLTVVRDLVSTYWEDLQPALSRLRARRAALLWLSDGVSAQLEAEMPHARWNSCLELAIALEAAADPHFPDKDCGLGGLRRGLARLATAPSQADAVSTPVTATAHEAVEARQGGGVLTPVADGAITDRADALRRLQELARFFQRTEPHGPIGYLVQRAAKWGELSFQEVYLDLLANNASAQSELWQVLGLPRPVDSNSST